MRRHDWRLVPVAVVTWVGSWAGTSALWSSPSLTIALVAGMLLITSALWLRHLRWLAVVVLVLTVVFALSGIRAGQLHDSPLARLARQRTVAVIGVRMAAEPHRGRQAVVAKAELVWVEARGRRITAVVPVVLFGTGKAGEGLLSASAGATYRAVAALAPAEPEDASAALLSLRQPVEQDLPPGPLDAVASAMRQGLREAMTASTPDQAALVPSLVVGDTSAVREPMKEQFRRTGLTHLMAVSGANLTLMLGVVLAAARVAGARGWWVRVIALLGVGAFVVVCGQEPSVMRAAAMGIVALAATGAGVGQRSLRMMSLAVTSLLFLDPWLSRSVGFALSVAACAGIVLLGPPMIQALARWAPRWLAEAFAVPLSAQLATQPIVTAISDEISMVGVLTNLLAGPFVGPTTVLGLIAALLSWLPTIAAGPGWAAGWCAQPILWLAHMGAALPAAAWRWDHGAFGVLLVMAGVAGVGIVLIVALRSPWGGVGLVLVLLLASMWQPAAPGWPGVWAVGFCDVGQGDATVLNAGGGSAVLIDAGPQWRPVGACLSRLGVRRAPLLVLTHYHADHTGGAREALESLRPSLVLVRAGPRPQWLEEAAAQSGAELRPASPGERLTIGQVAWTTVSVAEPSGAVVPEGEGESSAENDASVIGLAEAGGVRVLLAGDAEPQGQQVALRAAGSRGINLGVHVLKLPHHGSSRQEERFFAASKAVLAVASAGQGNPYGHPSRKTLGMAAEQGMRVARTDQQGSIVISLAEGRLTVRGEH